MENITEGLIVGVGAGVTTFAILGMWHLLIRWLKRREQIPYIRDLITNQRERILSATDILPSELGQNPIPADCVRFVFFRELQSALLVALSSRATALTYKEVSSLQNSLAEFDRVTTDLSLSESRVFPLAIAQSFFDQLESLTWLRLPNRRA